MLFSSLASALEAACLNICNSDEYSVIADTLNFVPLNINIVIFSKPEKAAIARNNDRQDPAVANIEFKISGVAKSRSAANVDYFLISQSL